MSYFLNDLWKKTDTYKILETGTLVANTVSIVTASIKDFPVNDGYDVFLVAGCSNSIGTTVGGTPTGYFPPVLEYPNPNIMQWISEFSLPAIALDRLKHPVASTAVVTTSIATSFAKHYHGYFRRKVLLVPCGLQGANLVTASATTATTAARNGRTVRNDWLVNAPYYNMTSYSIDETTKAMAYHPVRNPMLQSLAPDPANRFKGILWHHGERHLVASSTREAYGFSFGALVGNLRTNIGGATLSTPVLAGLMRSIHGSQPTQLALRDVGNVLLVSQTMCFAVDSADLTGDSTFFDIKSTREFGRRYFEKFVEVSS
jgi:hypothetical protein